MLVACNRCMACRVMRTGEWTTRLMLESFEHKDNCFITITYDDSFIGDDNLYKPVLQKFIKRLRFELSPIKIKYYAVGEYGEKSGRAHYHAIIFNWYPDDIYVHHSDGNRPFFSSKTLDKVWPYGMNNVGTVTSTSIDYVVGYIRKKLFGRKADEVYGFRNPPFALSSRLLGMDWIYKNIDRIKEEKCIKLNGRSHGIPRYFYKKIFDEWERYYFEEKRSNETDELIESYISQNGLSMEQMLDRVLGDRLQRERNLEGRQKLFIRRTL